MNFSRILLKNGHIFRSVDVPLGEWVFGIEPNAYGKSNFVDVFRFLRNIASSQGGGLQKQEAAQGFN